MGKVIDRWNKFDVWTRRLLAFAAVMGLISTTAGGCYAAYDYIAPKSDLEAFRMEYHFDKEKEKRKELREIVFECKKNYGVDYSKAPDEFTAKYCRDAEIELEESKED